MYVYALAQEWGSAPAPMTWKKGEEGKEGEDAGVGVVDMPVIAPKGARRRGSLQPSWGSAHPRRASGTEAAT